MTEEKSLDGIEVGYPGSISGANIPKCLSTIAPRFTLNNVIMKLLNAISALTGKMFIKQITHIIHTEHMPLFIINAHWHPSIRTKAHNAFFTSMALWEISPR